MFKRLNLEDCEGRDAHYRLVREGKRSFNLRPQKMADFLGQKPKNCPVSASFFGDREWGQKYNSNIFPSAAHVVRSAEENCRPAERPKPKEAKLWTEKRLLSSVLPSSHSPFLNPQLFSDPCFRFFLPFELDFVFLDLGI